MRVAVIQSCYVPWRGYFDVIDSVDLFLIYDDVQYSKGSWRNRNRLKTRAGLNWLTVPVRAHLGQRIDEIRIGQTTGVDWVARHRRLLMDALEPAPFFKDARNIWEAGVASAPGLLSELNGRLIRLVCEYLNISTPVRWSSDYRCEGEGTDRLLSLLRLAGARCYVSGPSAKAYLREDAFRSAGMRLEYKTYDYPAYPQLWGAFEGAVSVLDLIANCGPDARRYLSSRIPNEVAVP